MLEEIWKDIEGYEGFYQISSLGRIKSFKDNYGKYREKILSPTPNKDGYLFITLCKNGERQAKMVHRLVAEAFINNPNNLPQVNHINEIRDDNRVENLEWCTAKYNINYGNRSKKFGEKMKGRKLTNEHKRKIGEAKKGEKNPRAKKVRCITTGEIFISINEACIKYNLSHTSISKCCSGKQKYAGKHPITKEKLIWEYI